MSDPTADAFDTASVFLGSAIGTGLISAALTFPYNCQLGQENFSGEPGKNILGTYTFSEEGALVASTVLGLLFGGLCSAIASAINDRRATQDPPRS